MTTHEPFESSPEEVLPEREIPSAREALPFVVRLRTPGSRQLVERAQTGDAEALNELFTTYYGTMVELARRRLGPRLRMKEEADDLAQTTFREATRDFSQYQYRGEG